MTEARLSLGTTGGRVSDRGSDARSRARCCARARARASLVARSCGSESVNHSSRTPRMTELSSAGPESKPRQLHDTRTRSTPIGGHPSSTVRWNDVPRETMDEVSSHVRLDLPSPDG